MKILGDIMILLIIALYGYMVYRSLKANNIFMKNPSRKREDYLGDDRH